MENQVKEIPKDIVEKLELSSVYLVRLGAENLPGGIASGLLIDYKGSRHLCTAAHVLKKGPLSLQLEWSEKMRGTNTRLLNLQPIMAQSITCPEDFGGDKWRDLDFAYCKISFPDVPLHQDNDVLSGKVLSSRPCHIHKETDIATPGPDVQYGFFGQVRPKYEPYPHPILPDDIRYLNTIGCVCFPLTYLGDEGDFYTFRIPSGFTDHDDFRGCSGAPIIDLSGNVVALVCKGNLETSTLYGFPIQKFAIVLELSGSGILDNLPNE